MTIKERRNIKKKRKEAIRNIKAARDSLITDLLAELAETMKCDALDAEQQPADEQKGNDELR